MGKSKSTSSTKSSSTNKASAEQKLSSSAIALLPLEDLSPLKRDIQQKLNSTDKEERKAARAKLRAIHNRQKVLQDPQEQDEGVPLQNNEEISEITNSSSSKDSDRIPKKKQHQSRLSLDSQPSASDPVSGNTNLLDTSFDNDIDDDDSKDSNHSDGKEPVDSPANNAPSPSSPPSVPKIVTNSSTTNSPNGPTSMTSVLNLAPPSDMSIASVTKFIETALPELKQHGQTISHSDPKVASALRDSLAKETHAFNLYLMKHVKQTSKALTILAERASQPKLDPLTRYELESKPLPGKKIETSTDYERFVETLLKTCPYRTGWENGLHMKINPSPNTITKRHLIHDIGRLTEDEVTLHTFDVDPDTETACDTLYDSLQASCGTVLLNKVSIQKNKYGTNGFIFLYFLLKQLKEGVRKIVNTFEKVVKEFWEIAGSNKSKFETQISTLATHLKRVIDIGKCNSEKDTMELILTSLQSVPNGPFQSQLSTKVNQTKGRSAADMIVILQEASKIIQKLKEIKGWYYNSHQETAPTPNDITALNASTQKKTLKSKKRIRFEDPPTGKPDFKPVSLSKYTPKLHYGPKKHYKTETAFKAFQSGSLGKKSCYYGNVDWFWCNKCKLMTNHPSAHHDTCLPADSNKKRKRAGPPEYSPGTDDAEANLTALADSDDDDSQVDHSFQYDDDEDLLGHV